MSENTLVNAVYEKIFADNIPDKLAEGDVLTFDEIEVCMDKITEFAIEVIDHMIEVNQNNYAFWSDEMRKSAVRKLETCINSSKHVVHEVKECTSGENQATVECTSGENQATTECTSGENQATAECTESVTNDIPQVDNTSIDDKRFPECVHVSPRTKYYTDHYMAYFRWASQPNIMLSRTSVSIEDYYAAHGLLDELKSCEPIKNSIDLSIIAARNGQCEIIRWLMAAGYATSVSIVFIEAAKNGHLNFLKYIDEFSGSKSKIRDYAAVVAAAAGHLHIVQWMLLRGCDVGTIKEAAKDQPAVLEWINSMYA